MIPLQEKRHGNKRRNDDSGRDVAPGDLILVQERTGGTGSPEMVLLASEPGAMEFLNVPILRRGRIMTFYAMAAAFPGMKRRMVVEKMHPCGKGEYPGAQKSRCYVS